MATTIVAVLAANSFDFGRAPRRGSRSRLALRLGLRVAERLGLRLRIAESRDATVEIADEVRRRFVEYDEVPASLLRFLDAASRH